VEGYGRRRYKGDFIRYLTYSISECDETIVHLEFLDETGSLKDKPRTEFLKAEYASLSKKINKFIQWVESNLGPLTPMVRWEISDKLSPQYL